MKLALSNGQEFKVVVRFGEKVVNIKDDKVKVRTTEVLVTPGQFSEGKFRPSGETLASTASCDSREQFCKASGRYAAVLKLFDSDTEQAFDRLVNELEKKRTSRASPIGLKEEDGSLQQAVRPYYKIDRPMRTLVFKAVCPEFSAARREQQEKTLYLRLHRKYGQEGGMAEASQITVKQKAKTVKGSMVGVVIGTVGPELKRQAAK